MQDDPYSRHLNNLGHNQRQINSALGQLQNEVESLRRREGPNQETRAPMRIEDIPGMRTPRWYEVSIDFTAGDTALRFNSAEIAPDGPFVITQCSPYWTITDTTAANFFGPPAAAPTGRILPCSPYGMLQGLFSGIIDTTAGVPAANVPNLGDMYNGAQFLGALSDFPEMSFQIEVSGSGRFWTNQRIPAADFYGWGGSPMYLGHQGWVERTDRLVVHCTPEVAIPHDGRVRFVFSGYQILGPINITDSLAL